MGKHTPGPWEAAYVDDEMSAGQFWIHGPDSFICCTDESDNPAADARLIAAAPELLEALKALVDEQNGPPLIRREAEYLRALKAAESAIAKAEGA